VGPFEILERVGEVAYRLALPPALDDIHPVFHVSQLRLYIPDPSHRLSYEELSIEPDHTYRELPVQILDRRVKQLRNKEIQLVLIQWSHQNAEEATWEVTSRMRESYPEIFPGLEAEFETRG